MIKSQSRRIQFLVYTGLWLAVVAMTGLLTNFDRNYFQRFIGELNPLLVIVISGALGFLLLRILLAKDWFIVYEKGKLIKALRYFGWVFLLVSVAIGVDWEIVFSEDMNIPWPASLLFYPVIAFFVEILFHVLPLTALLMAVDSLFKKDHFEKLLWVSIFLVALLEPAYQAWFMGAFPVWAILVIFLNLFFFNLAQLILFRRYDFITMYLFRILYYVLWHIAWGYFRLEWLF